MIISNRAPIEFFLEWLVSLFYIKYSYWSLWEHKYHTCLSDNNDNDDDDDDDDDDFVSDDNNIDNDNDADTASVFNAVSIDISGDRASCIDFCHDIFITNNTTIFWNLDSWVLFLSKTSLWWWAVFTCINTLIVCSLVLLTSSIGNASWYRHHYRYQHYHN